MRSRIFSFAIFSFIIFTAAACLRASEPVAPSESSAAIQEAAAEIPASGKLKVAIYSLSMQKKRIARILEEDGAFECTPVSGEDIKNGILEGFDFVLLPGGSGRGQARSMQPEGVANLKKFVHDGNGYLGICAGAYFPMQQGFLNGNTKSPKWLRGEEHLDLELTEEGLEVFGEEFRGIQKVRYANGPVFDINIDPNMPQVEVLAWFRSETAKNGTPAGIQVNSPAMVRTTYGNGMLITFSPHPESSDTLCVFLPKALRYMAKYLNKPIPENAPNQPAAEKAN